MNDTQETTNASFHLSFNMIFLKYLLFIQSIEQCRTKWLSTLKFIPLN